MILLNRKDDIMGIVFSDTDAKPTGRKARTVSADLWQVLADSAKRGVAKVAEADEQVISELLKDLGSAAVRKKFTLTTATKALDTGGIRLTFHAVEKPPEPASAEQPGDQVHAAADPSQAKRRG
jgi:hypothetical protein